MLQALRESGVSDDVLEKLDSSAEPAKSAFDQLDYMSAVSGGAYVAGWVQAHLGAHKTFKRDKFYYEVQPDTSAKLLNDNRDAVEHVRLHTGFLNRGRFTEMLWMPYEYLWRLPVHFVLDDVFHLRGFNFQHLNGVYQGYIESTFFRGEVPDGPDTYGAKDKKDTPLREINDIDRAELTPYLILNANLTNSGASQVLPEPQDAERECSSEFYRHDLPYADCRDKWNFEFTRNFVGSDATGYIETPGFGAHVDRVIRGGCDGQTPVAAEVDFCSENLLPSWSSVCPETTSSFPLSRAVAASGAAFDSTGLLQQWQAPGVTEAGQVVAGGVFNAYLGLDIPNFARTYDGASSAWDFARMITYQRVPRWADTGARWLYLTDGGHYENLGVLSLLRRGVQCVVAIDATRDAGRTYDDLKTLRKRVSTDLKMTWLTPLPADGSDPEGHYRFMIGDRDRNLQAVVLYLKSNANKDLPHMKPEYGAQLAHDRIWNIYRATLRDLPNWKGSKICVENRIVSANEAVAREKCEKGRALARYQAEQSNVARTAAKIEFLGLPAPAASVTDGPVGLIASVSATPPPKLAECLVPPQTFRNKENEGNDQQTLRRLQQWLDTTLERNEKLYRALFCPEEDGDINEQDRPTRIKELLAYASYRGSGGFPHGSTLVEMFDWERFEAYRGLGYEMANTYLDRFEPAKDTAEKAAAAQAAAPGNLPTASPTPDLSWCDFVQPSDDDAP